MLACLKCKQILIKGDDYLQCPVCNQKYLRRSGTVFFIPNFNPDEEPGFDAVVSRLKSYLKQYHPRLFLFFYFLIAAFVGKSSKKAIQNLPADALVINIGSGIKIIDSRVINIDLYPYPNVAIVARATELPFQDNSVDAVISESLLEHLPRPEKAIDEMRRVLKPGGLLYILTPFVLGFHSSPGDYYRWTASGLREILKDFQEEELGVAVGPTGALTAILREWLAMLLSFNLRILFQLWTLFFMVLFIPLNALDWLLARFSPASNIALAFYFIGTKRYPDNKT